MENTQVIEHIRMLTDQDGIVRQIAANVLGEIGDASAVPAIIEALKDKNESVRPNAAKALGNIGDVSAVPTLIEALKDKDKWVRDYAADALGKIGDVSAVPALLEALKDKDADVRWDAADALGKIGDISAVPALIEALRDKELRDEDEGVRLIATEALGRIGDATAVPALIEALKDKNGYVQLKAASALGNIGDSNTLPRKILAYSRWSAQDRINALEKLRRGHYNEHNMAVRYEFPETRALCQTVLSEQDDEARKAAQSVLDWLNGDRHLLRASQPDPCKQSEELLRPTQGGEPETRPETLLRASDNPEKEVIPVPKQPTIWQRLFGNRRGGAL